jgi:hypothetical protein
VRRFNHNRTPTNQLPLVELRPRGGGFADARNRKRHVGKRAWVGFDRGLLGPPSVPMAIVTGSRSRWRGDGAIGGLSTMMLTNAPSAGQWMRLAGVFCIVLGIKKQGSAKRITGVPLRAQYAQLCLGSPFANIIRNIDGDNR